MTRNPHGTLYLAKLETYQNLPNSKKKDIDKEILPAFIQPRKWAEGRDLSKVKESDYKNRFSDLREAGAIVAVEVTYTSVNSSPSALETVKQEINCVLNASVPDPDLYKIMIHEKYERIWDAIESNPDLFQWLPDDLRERCPIDPVTLSSGGVPFGSEDELKKMIGLHSLLSEHPSPMLQLPRQP